MTAIVTVYGAVQCVWNLLEISRNIHDDKHESFIGTCWLDFQAYFKLLINTEPEDGGNGFL